MDKGGRVEGVWLTNIGGPSEGGPKPKTEPWWFGFGSAMLSNGGGGWWMLVGLLMKSNGSCGATNSQMRAGERG